MTVILGGGLAGLSAAHYALNSTKLAGVTLLESTGRLGGWIRTHKLPDGTIFEQGPRTIRTGGWEGINTLNLLEDISLSEKVVPFKRGDPVLSNRLLYVNGQLHTMPNGFRDIFKKSVPFGERLIKLLVREAGIPPKTTDEDETVYDFVERRFGKTAAENFASSLICGICAGDARQISAPSLLKQMYDYERIHGSVVRGYMHSSNESRRRARGRAQSTFNAGQPIDKNSCGYLSDLAKQAETEFWNAWVLQGGMELLPRTLAKSLVDRGLTIEKGQKCEELTFKPDCVELVVNGKSRKCSYVVSALPARVLGDLVQNQHPELAKELKAIPTITVAIVNLKFNGKVLPTEGFGLLVPPKEEIPILGITFDSCIIQQDSTVLTIMMGGAWFEKYFGKSPPQELLVTTAISHARKMLRITDDPVTFHLSVLKDCIPQYVLGHRERLNRIGSYIVARQIPLALCGSSYQGIGVNDVILSGKQAISKLVASISH